MSLARLSACMLICHKGHTDTIQVYSVTVMAHVKALQAGHSSRGTSEPITPVRSKDSKVTKMCADMVIFKWLGYLMVDVWLKSMVMVLYVYGCK